MVAPPSSVNRKKKKVLHSFLRLKCTILKFFAVRKMSHHLCHDLLELLEFSSSKKIVKRGVVEDLD